MSYNPYERFSKAELILRDELAIDRTMLANERTLLSYLRGALTMVVAGVSLCHFVEPGVLYYIGIALVPLGVASGIFGAMRHRAMDRSIRALRQSLEHTKETGRP